MMKFRMDSERKTNHLVRSENRNLFDERFWLEALIASENIYGLLSKRDKYKQIHLCKYI